MKYCELCSFPAKMYCESDEATLCWDCDEKVHSANFLVAKHSRILLCHLCQSPTPWQASGPKLGLTLSLCQVCVHNASKNDKVEHQVEEQSQGGNQYEEENEEDDDDDVEEDYSDNTDEEEEEEEEEGDNQVVPWSSFPSPPALTTSSTSEEASSSRGGVKRARDDPHLEFDPQDDIDGDAGSTAILRSGGSEDDEATSYRSKVQRTITSGEIQNLGGQESRTASIVNTLNRFHRSLVPGDQNQSAMVIEICKFSRDG